MGIDWTMVGAALWAGAAFVWSLRVELRLRDVRAALQAHREELDDAEAFMASHRPTPTPDE